MLSDMTVANGYSRNYTPVPSVRNDSATMEETPYIGIDVGEEEELFEGVGINQYRAIVPITIVARARSSHKYPSEEELEVHLERAEVIEDIKKRFAKAYLEIDSCTQFEPIGQQEAQEDSNKFCFFTEYTFGLTYKQMRQ